MKKGRILGAKLLVVAALLMLVFTGTFMQKVSAYAQDDLSANSIFLDEQVESSGYLYNFDGSADYIYEGFYLTAPQIGVSNNTCRFCIGNMNVYYL